MAAVTPNINQARAMRVAMKRIEGFAKQFGETYRNLACHAAFPLVLTPDLLYQIWANFVPEAPWTAVAHMLLSRLCRQVGYEIYEMDIADRNLLLRELKEHFGQERLDELGEFLLDYVAQRLTEDDADTQDLSQAQAWTALAYTKPDQVARELAEALSAKVKQGNVSELFRLTSLVETFAEPLAEAGFKPLLIYANGIKSFFSGDLEDAKVQFSKLPVQDCLVTTKIAGVSLDMPNLSPQETITVRNTAKPARKKGKNGERLWDWTVYIESNPYTLSQIHCVEYTLHPTFPKPVITIYNNENNFALKANGWGEFLIKIRVFFTDGSSRDLSHWLQLSLNA